MVWGRVVTGRLIRVLRTASVPLKIPVRVVSLDTWDEIVLKVSNVLIVAISDASMI